MNIDLSTNYAGLKLRNPIIAGPSDITWSANLMKKAADAGAGAVTVKTQHLTIPHDNRQFEERRRKLFRVMNASGKYDPKLAAKGVYFTLAVGGPAGQFKSEEIVPQVAKASRMIDIPLIVSISGTSLDEIDKMARMNAEAGASAIEIIDPQHYTMLYGLPSLEFNMADAVKVVKKATGLPVSAKVTSALDDPADTVKRLEDAGASMIVAVGETSMKGLDIDVDTGKAFLDTNAYLGCYGSWFKSISLSWVARAAQVSNIPIAGISGVTSWKNAVEYLMAGATAVELCSAIYVRGFRVIKSVVTGIHDFMERKGYEKIDDFRGTSLRKFLSKEKVQQEFAPRLAYVDVSKCNGCGICAEVCCSEAPAVLSGKASIDPEKCEGCELCAQICPAEAVSLRKRRETSYPSKK